MLVRAIGRMYLEQITVLCDKIGELEKALRREARRGEKTSRLQTMPGIGPITAIAIETFAPAMTTFKRGRFCCVARSRANSAFDRTQTEARTHVEDGPTRYSATSHYRRDGRHSLGFA